MPIKIGVFPGDTDPQFNPEPVPVGVDSIQYVVEVYREQSITEDVYRIAKGVELVRPGGTLVNVGHGPSLPQNPYEGQVWILT